MSSRGRHSPQADLGVGLALLIGGLGFLLVSLFAGWGPAWSFVGGVAGMTGAGKSYRAGRNLQHRRRGGPKPVPRSHRWSQALPWASERYGNPGTGRTKQGGSSAGLPCSPACLISTAPRSACRCSCGGTRHGTEARGGGARGKTRNGRQTGQRTTRLRKPQP